MINLGDITQKLEGAAEAIRLLAEAVCDAVREAADKISASTHIQLPELTVPSIESFIETIRVLLSDAEDVEPDPGRDWMKARQAEARVFAPQRAAARARAFAREMVAEKARAALRRRKWALHIDYWHGEIRAFFCLKKSSENFQKGLDLSHNV